MNIYTEIIYTEECYECCYFLNNFNIDYLGGCIYNKEGYYMFCNEADFINTCKETIRKHKISIKEQLK